MITQVILVDLVWQESLKRHEVIWPGFNLD